MTKEILDAVINTLVFKRNPDGSLRSVIDDKPIPDSENMSENDLYNYYEGKTEELKTALKRDELRSNYQKQAQQLVTRSAFRVKDKFHYINPFSNLPVVTPNEAYLKIFSETLEKKLNEHILNKQPLPFLPTPEEWEKQTESYKSKVEVPTTFQPFPPTEYKLLDEWNSQTSQEAVAGGSKTNPQPPTIPANIALPHQTPQTSNLFEALGQRNMSSNFLRQNAKPFGFDVEKDVYMIHFRKYVRMLRRFSNMILIHRGLVEEVTYMYFKPVQETTPQASETEPQKSDDTVQKGDDNIEYDIHHPFFTEESEEVKKKAHKRLSTLMGIRKFRFTPYMFLKK